MKRFIPVLIVLAGVLLAAMVLALPAQVALAEPQNGYGTIVIHKSITDYAGKDGTFSFEVVKEDGTITYTADVTTIYGTGVYTIYPVTDFGTYTITELPQEGWVDEGSICISSGGRSNTIEVWGVDPAHCTFYNLATTNVYVHKTVEGADSEFEFEYYVSNYGYYQSFPISTVNGEGTYTITLPDSSGYFYMNENVPDQYDLQDDYCLVNGQKTYPSFDFFPYDQIHCNFTNVELANVTITKTVPSFVEYASFEFLLYSPPENSDSWMGEVWVGVNGAITGTGSDVVPPGLITLAELENPDYDPGEATCTQNDGPPFNPAAGPFLLEPGGDLECEVSNVAAKNDATILVWKAYPSKYDDRASYDNFFFLLTPIDGGIPSYSELDYQGDDVYYAEFSVPAGEYLLEEGETLDTELVDAFCRKDGVEFPLTTLVVAEGDFIECFFTNQDLQGTLVLQKVITGTVVTDTFEVFTHLYESCFYDGGCNEFEEFQEKAISIPVISSFGEVRVDLDPGYYMISEFFKEDYLWVDSKCVTSEGDTGGQNFYTIKPGEVVTCTLTNAYIPEPVEQVTITISKSAEVTDTFPILVGYEPQGNPLWTLAPLTADQPMEGVYGGEVTLHGMPGNYSITEGDTLGWTNMGIHCFLDGVPQYPAPYVSLRLEASAHLKCTIFNEQSPVVHFLKQADHPGKELTIGLIEPEQDWPWTENIDMQELCGDKIDGTTYWCSEFIFELDPYQSYDPCFPDNCREVTREPARLLTVFEDLDDGWVLDEAVCTSETAPVTGTTILMTDSDRADCTFTNRLGGRVQIYKYFEPEIGTDEAYTATFSFEGDAGEFQLDVPVYYRYFPEYDWGYWENYEDITLPPGNYTVTEDPIPGWILDNIKCGKGEGRAAGASDELFVSPGDTLYCSAINVPDTGQGLYLSSDTGGVVGGLTFADEDIVVYDGGAWSMYFDGSTFGLNQADLDAFAFDNNGDVLLSLDIDFYFPGIATKISDEDIVKYFPATNMFSWYMDSSDVALTTTSEDIDAIEVLPDGCLLLSTWGDFVVSGATGQDEDILKFCPRTLGSYTTGTFSLYFNGTTPSVGLTLSTENLDALFLTEELRSPLLHFSTLGNFGVPGPVSGEGKDIFTCSPAAYGVAAACSYDPSLYFDGSVEGFPGSVDAAELEGSAPPPQPKRSMPVKSARPSEM